MERAVGKNKGQYVDEGEVEVLHLASSHDLRGEGVRIDNIAV
jgi:hypothetical protein